MRKNQAVATNTLERGCAQTRLKNVNK